MKKNKKLIVIALVVVVIIVGVIVYNRRAWNAPFDSLGSEAIDKPKYTADTLLQNKAPLVSNEFARMIQEDFNSLAAHRKDKGITPELTELKVDGLFGAKTSAAVALIMGKTSITYNEWSAFISPLIAMITNTSN